MCSINTAYYNNNNTLSLRHPPSIIIHRYHRCQTVTHFNHFDTANQHDLYFFIYDIGNYITKVWRYLFVSSLSSSSCSSSQHIVNYSMRPLCSAMAHATPFPMTSTTPTKPNHSMVNWQASAYDNNTSSVTISNQITSTNYHSSTAPSILDRSKHSLTPANAVNSLQLLILLVCFHLLLELLYRRE